MSNPFKKITSNAETSGSKLYEDHKLTETLITTRSCNCCGAPRPKNSNLVKCDYCKTLFMENIENLNADS